MYVAGTMLVVCERFGLLNKADDGKKQQRSAGSVNGAPETPRRSVSGVLLDNYKTTLPTKKGLSSSAAVCVLVVRALCLVFHLQLSVPQVRCPALPNKRVQFLVDDIEKLLDYNRVNYWSLFSWGGGGGG